MKENKILNHTARALETVVFTGVVILYIFLIYVSAFIDNSIFSSYFIITSFVYYLLAIKNTNVNQNNTYNSPIKGVCPHCNRLRTVDTKHCFICNSCYFQHDHHSILLGRCISMNNIKDFMFCVLFGGLFLFSWLFYKESKGIIALCLFSTFLFLILKLGNLVNYKDVFLGREVIRRLVSGENKIDFCKRIRMSVRSAVGVMLPFLRIYSKIECME